MAISDPWRLIVRENVAYLADDQARSAAFAALRRRVGLTPAKIAAAPPATLVEIAGAGILAQGQADKLRTCAQLALAVGVSDATLRRFPGIGLPGADRIALLAGWRATPTVDSNGLRVLSRLGYVGEERSYAATYARAVAVLARSFHGRAALVRAYKILRTHGKGLCRRTRPRCDECPLRGACRYARSANSPTRMRARDGGTGR